MLLKLVAKMLMPHLSVQIDFFGSTFYCVLATLSAGFAPVHVNVVRDDKVLRNTMLYQHMTLQLVFQTQDVNSTHPFLIFGCSWAGWRLPLGGNGD